MKMENNNDNFPSNGILFAFVWAIAMIAIGVTALVSAF